MYGSRQSSGDVVLLAATNLPDMLDPALTRPGRLDRQLAVSLPDLQGRRAILQVRARLLEVSPFQGSLGNRKNVVPSSAEEAGRPPCQYFNTADEMLPTRVHSASAACTPA